MAVCQKRVPKMEPWEMGTCELEPVRSPGGFILTHPQMILTKETARKVHTLAKYLYRICEITENIVLNSKGLLWLLRSFCFAQKIGNLFGAFPLVSLKTKYPQKTHTHTHTHDPLQDG